MIYLFQISSLYTEHPSVGIKIILDKEKINITDLFIFINCKIAFCQKYPGKRIENIFTALYNNALLYEFSYYRLFSFFSSSLCSVRKIKLKENSSVKKHLFHVKRYHFFRVRSDFDSRQLLQNTRKKRDGNTS